MTKVGEAVAKYKPCSYSQGQFIPVFFSKQIWKGTFEYTLGYLVDNALDLNNFNLLGFPDG